MAEKIAQAPEWFKTAGVYVDDRQEEWSVYLGRKQTAPEGYIWDVDAEESSFWEYNWTRHDAADGNDFDLICPECHENAAQHPDGFPAGLDHVSDLNERVLEWFGWDYEEMTWEEQEKFVEQHPDRESLYIVMPVVPCEPEAGDVCEGCGGEVGSITIYAPELGGWVFITSENTYAEIFREHFNELPDYVQAAIKARMDNRYWEEEEEEE